MPELIRPVEDRDHAQGPASAPVTLLVYGDYQCPYTRKAYLSAERARRELGDRLCFVFRHFPLSRIHPHAQGAAEAAEAAGAQGRFWEMHDQLFRNQQALDDSHLGQYAAELGLDRDAFERQMAGRVHADRVLEDYESGHRGGVSQTPTLFVNGAHYAGLYDTRALLAVLEDAGSQGEEAGETTAPAGDGAGTCRWEL
ncbi:DsbA family protein [soil metagenome]